MNCSSKTRVLLLALVIGFTSTNSTHGQEFSRLTDDGRIKFSPVSTADGKAIIYVDLVDPTLFQLKKLNLETREISVLHDKSATSEFEPCRSRDGSAYAYLKTIGVLSVSVVIQSESGTQLGEVLPDPGFAGLRSPALSPDASLVAFSYAENSRQQVFSSRPDGSDRKDLTNSQGINNWPCFSPDGEQIVFGSSRDGDFEIYVMNKDGGSAKRLTHSPNQDIRPKVSPDGKQIAFVSHRDGNAEIYLMDMDGQNPRRITNHEERDDYVDWMPDGKHIVFVGERDGMSDLYTVTVEPAAQ